jgi:hypothetical protein
MRELADDVAQSLHLTVNEALQDIGWVVLEKSENPLHELMLDDTYHHLTMEAPSQESVVEYLDSHPESKEVTAIILSTLAITSKVGRLSTVKYAIITPEAFVRMCKWDEGHAVRYLNGNRGLSLDHRMYRVLLQEQWSPSEKLSLDEMAIARIAYQEFFDWGLLPVSELAFAMRRNSDLWGKFDSRSFTFQAIAGFDRVHTLAEWRAVAETDSAVAWESMWFEYSDVGYPQSYEFTKSDALMLAATYSFDEVEPFLTDFIPVPHMLECLENGIDFTLARNLLSR